jgi:hypothetical protein
MAHFAKIENDTVVQVIVAEQDFINKLDGEWIQTSYNTRGGVHYNPNTGLPSSDQSKALRKNYAGIGFIYDRDNDMFITPKPYESWLLNLETGDWDSPIPYPDDGQIYYWNESILNWELVDYNS